jgi:hypothetical protein
LIATVVSCSPLPGFITITAARIAMERPDARLALGKRRASTIPCQDTIAAPWATIRSKDTT